MTEIVTNKMAVRLPNGSYHYFDMVRGKEGKSAYKAAVEAGYEGTEDQFNKEMSEVGIKTDSAVTIAEEAAACAQIAEQKATEAEEAAQEAKSDVNNKLDKPTTPGEEGQALFSDGEGGTIFKSISQGMQMDLLWENASPTSQFAPQTLQFDVSQYDLLFVELRDYQQAVYTHFNYSQFFNLTPINNDRQIYFNSTAGGYGTSLRYAYYNLNDNVNLVFGDGVFIAWGETNKAVNQQMGVPLKIYGVKL